MSYWILTISGRVISCTTVQQLNEVEMKTDDWHERMKQYDVKVKERLKTNDQDISHKMVHMDELNRLSTEKIDQSFKDEFNKVINNN